MKVFWSNIYVKFKQFMFLADDAIEWVVKPDPVSGSWLRVEVKPAKMKKFEVNVETIALCRLVNENHGFSFNHLPKEKQPRPLPRIGALESSVCGIAGAGNAIWAIIPVCARTTRPKSRLKFAS